jgi:hypothetical protein
MHLDPAVRRASSTWHALPPSVLDTGLDRLRQDLERAVSGTVAEDSCGRRPRLTWACASSRRSFVEDRTSIGRLPVSITL